MGLSYMITLRPVRVDDVRAYTGEDLIPDYATMPPFGWVAEAGGELVGIGFVVWDKWGRAWGSFNRRSDADGKPYVPALLVHKKAKEMIDWLREAGQPALYAECSQTIPGAAKWLERLGFKHDPVLSANNRLPVFVCTLST